MHFGRMVAEAREESRMSLRELAGRVKASAATLSKIESAEHLPRDPIITRLIQVLRLNEHAVRAQVARQRAIRHDGKEQPFEEASELSPVPVVGKIRSER